VTVGAVVYFIGGSAVCGGGAEVEVSALTLPADTREEIDFAGRDRREESIASGVLQLPPEVHIVGRQLGADNLVPDSARSRPYVNVVDRAGAGGD
jgi:hypothetical protein